MAETGYDRRELMEVFVPNSNRLLAAFVLTKELPKLARGIGDVLSNYALVEVLRNGEYTDCEASDFKEVTDGFKAQFGDVLDSSKEEIQEEFNRRMKSMNLDKATVSIGKPIQLGRFFSKQDAYGAGMIVPVSMGSKTTKMGASIVLVRAKKRLLFVYLYAEYKTEETVKQLRETSEEWTDAILNANK